MNEIEAPRIDNSVYAVRDLYATVTHASCHSVIIISSSSPLNSRACELT